MGTNLLTNPGSEAGWTRRTHTGQQFGEIFVPEGWVAFWREGGPVPHDPQNNIGYGRPEMHVINREPPFLDPPRIHSGNRVVKLFTFYRIHDAGLYQSVAVPPGTRPLFRFRARLDERERQSTHQHDLGRRSATGHLPPGD